MINGDMPQEYPGAHRWPIGVMNPIMRKRAVGFRRKPSEHYAFDHDDGLWVSVHTGDRIDDGEHVRRWAAAQSLTVVDDILQMISELSPANVVLLDSKRPQSEAQPAKMNLAGILRYLKDMPSDERWKLTDAVVALNKTAMAGA